MLCLNVDNGYFWAHFSYAKEEEVRFRVARYAVTNCIRILPLNPYCNSKKLPHINRHQVADRRRSFSAPGVNSPGFYQLKPGTYLPPRSAFNHAGLVPGLGIRGLDCAFDPLRNRKWGNAASGAGRTL